MKKSFSVKTLLIGFLAAVCFICSVLSFGLMGKKTKTVSAAEENKVEVYQLAPNDSYLLESYVIKTANNKLVVIDGGTDGVFADDTASGSAAALAAPAYLPAALRAIAGLADGTEVEVEAWFLSHAHRDHFSELGKIMSQGSASGVKINNVYFDFPDFVGSFPMSNSQQANLEDLKTAFDAYGLDYDELNGAVVNAESVGKGLSITVDGVRFDVLQTWDIADGYYDDLNDTSMVIRMVTGDNSVLFLNDLAIAGGERLTATYTADELRSDYVQLSHHGHAGLTKAQYIALGITADTKLLWPTPSVTFTDPTNFFVDETYMWMNDNASYVVDGVVDTSKVDKTKNFFACLYGAYPADTTSVSDWASCVSGMKVASFDYVDKGFEMLGASVRLADPDGIRFVAQVSSAVLTENATYGIILLPADLDTGADLTLDTQGAVVVACNELWSDSLCETYGVKDGYKAFSGALLAQQEGDEAIPFPTSFYNRPLTAVGYVTDANGNTVYTEKITRSIGYVATLESLKSTYEEKVAVERVLAGTHAELSINDGNAFTDTKLYTPSFTVGGTDVSVSSAANVSYTSDNEAAVKVIGDKLQAVADGITNVTATLSLDGEKKLSKTVEITVALVDPTAPITLNDCLEVTDISGSTVTKVAQEVGGETGTYLKVDGAQWGMTYVPFKDGDGNLLTAAQLTSEYASITLRIYIETEGLAMSVPTENIVTTTGSWCEVTITSEILTGVNAGGIANYSDAQGLYLQFNLPGTIYLDGVTAIKVQKDEKLATPVVEVWQDGTAIWKAVEGATAYEYTVDGLNYQTTTACSVQLAGKKTIKVKALGDGVTCQDSEYSETIQYEQKELLNGCEYNVNGWVESNATVTLNAGNATQGYFAYGVTSSANAYVNLWLKRNYAPADLSKYDYIEMSVNVVSEVGCTLFGADYATSITAQALWPLIPGEQVVRISVSALESTGSYNASTGVATFWLGGAVSMYVDNIVGIVKTDAAREILLNDCESATGFWCDAGVAVNTDTNYIVQGSASVTVSTAKWAPINLYWGTSSITDYETVKMTIFSTAAVKLLAGDINFITDPNCILADLVVGRNDVEIPVSKLVDYNLTANIIAPYLSGAATLCFDNIVGVTAPAAPITFGNTFILGDSYSTFEGWLPRDYAPWYTVGDDFGVNGETDVTAVEHTWWHQLLTETNSNLIQNCSYSGTTICNAPTGWGGTDETHRSFITRFEKAVNEGVLNGVDTIFLYGGTNDFWLGDDNVPKGAPKYSNWTDEDLKQTYPALCYLLNMMQWHAPNARIIVLMNVNALSAREDGVSTFTMIANAYGVEYVQLTYSESDLSTGHPTVQGMTMTKNAIINALSAN